MILTIVLDMKPPTDGKNRKDDLYAKNDFIIDRSGHREFNGCYRNSR